MDLTRTPAVDARPRAGAAPRSRGRRAALVARAALASLVVVALSGCIRLDYDLQIAADDTVDGSIVVAFKKELLALGGQSPDDALKSLTASPIVPTQGAGGGTVTTEPYDQDGYVGQRVTISDAPLSTFDKTGSGDGNALRLFREGDLIKLVGELDFSDSGSSLGSGLGGGLGGGSPSASPDVTASPSGNGAIAPRVAPRAAESPSPSLPFDPSVLLAGFEARVVVTFPGELVEANGTIEGQTVTWSAKPGVKTELKATSRSPLQPAGTTGVSTLTSSKGPLGFPLWAWVLLGLAVVLALVLALLIARRGRGTPVAAGAPTAPLEGLPFEQPTAWGAPGQPSAAWPVPPPVAPPGPPVQGTPPPPQSWAPPPTPPQAPPPAPQAPPPDWPPPPVPPG